MHSGVAVLSLLSLIIITSAVVHETIGAIPSGWVTASKLADGSSITLTIALHLQNLDQLEPKLLAVSTPGNPHYGQFLDISDVNSIFAPSAQAYTAIQAWLESYGIKHVHNDGHFINFATDVTTANRLLNTTFKNYNINGLTKSRTTQYSLPDTLTQYIDFISPTIFFAKTRANLPPHIRTKRSKPAPPPKPDPPSKPASPPKPAAPPKPATPPKPPIPTNPCVIMKRQLAAPCQTSITPSCLKQLYNVGNYTAISTSGSRLGFSSFTNQSALLSDLAQFETLNIIPAQNFYIELINGGTDNQDPTTAETYEAGLDVQTLIGISHPLPVTEFITGGLPPYIPNLEQSPEVGETNEPYLPYYQYLLSKPNSELPLVLSNSYGDDEQTVPFYYARRVCNMIGILGLRGITIIESSGDTGVGAACRANDGSNKTQFTPQFPASCPYVTSVGGTVDLHPEVGWNTSSGGFSNYFKRAWYQEQAVGRYLDSGISAETQKYYKPYTNFEGRGFPDVSAHSLGPVYQIVYYSAPDYSGGTSAAAPVWAGIIALLNDARLRAGKPQLGFINPLLYSLAAKKGGLTDITEGIALGCTGTDLQNGKVVPGAGVVPWASWNATAGWDPVTGLGTPDFEGLKKVVLSC